MTRREKILALRNADPLVLPSMLLCDFANLADEVRKLEAAGFRALHLDVMDGVFVPNFSYGMTIVNAFHQCTDLPLDVHLMMEGPEKYIEPFHASGADSITFHIEAVDDPGSIIQQIHGLGMAAGVAIDRDTPVSAIAEIIDQVDMVLVMTIKAGFGGQSFIPGLLDKLREIRQLATTNPILQVDGGVNASTIGACVDAGAEWMVVGSGVFKQENYLQAHRDLLQHCSIDQP